MCYFIPKTEFFFKLAMMVVTGKIKFINLCKFISQPYFGEVNEYDDDDREWHCTASYMMVDEAGVTSYLSRCCLFLFIMLCLFINLSWHDYKLKILQAELISIATIMEYGLANNGIITCRVIDFYAVFTRFFSGS